MYRTTKGTVGRSSRKGLLEALAWMIFGAIFAGAGLLIFFLSQPYENGITTTGVVVDHHIDSDSDGNTYAPIVEFETEAGETVTFRSRASSSSRDRLGSQVRVSYEPSDPSGARNLDGGGSTMGLIALAIGLVVLAVGLARPALTAVLAVLSVRKNRELDRTSSNLGRLAPGAGEHT